MEIATTCNQLKFNTCKAKVSCILTHVILLDPKTNTWPCNKQSSSQFFFDFLKQRELPKTLSLSQTHRSTQLKKDKAPPHSSFYFLKATRTIKKLPPSHTHGSNTKRKKTLSRSLPLILSGPATRKGKSFHARVILFLFSPQEPETW